MTNHTQRRHATTTPIAGSPGNTGSHLLENLGSREADARQRAHQGPCRDGKGWLPVPSPWVTLWFSVLVAGEVSLAASAVSSIPLRPGPSVSGHDPVLALILLGAAALAFGGFGFAYLIRRMDRQRAEMFRLLWVLHDWRRRALSSHRDLAEAARDGGNRGSVEALPREGNPSPSALSGVTSQTPVPGPSLTEDPDVPSTSPGEKADPAGGALLPRVVVARQLIQVICAEIRDFLRRHGEGVESGGMLLGDFVSEDGRPTLVVNGYIDAGPAVDFSGGSILFDGDYQQKKLQIIQITHPNARTVGCIHRHPGRMDECSYGDELADREAVKESVLKALVFGIVTVNNPNRDPLSIRHDEFKIDFFLMAAATNYQYVHIRPDVDDRPLAQASEAVEWLLATRGEVAFQDLGALKRIAGVESTSLALADSPAGHLLLCTVQGRGAAGVVHVIQSASGGTRLCRRDASTALTEMPGPWLDPVAGRHIWLSHLVLLALNRTERGTCAARIGRHFSDLLQDKHRLVAEVRAMQERSHGRAVLRLEGGILYWEYTVRERGRHLPVRIEYPAGYPAEPPSIMSVRPLPQTPHQLGGNRICWIDWYSSTCRWNPSRDTAAICINAAHWWFACFLFYQTRGFWPIEE